MVIQKNLEKWKLGQMIIQKNRSDDKRKFGKIKISWMVNSITWASVKYKIEN